MNSNFMEELYKIILLFGGAYVCKFVEKGTHTYAYVNIHRLISSHKFQLLLFKVKDSLQLCSSVLDLLMLHILLCVSDFSLPENWDNFFASVCPVSMRESTWKGPM